MGLASYKPAHHEVTIEGGSFTVKGLSLEAISYLVQYHMPDLEAIFEMFQSVGNLDDENMRPFVTALVQNAPGLVANVIAVAADEPDNAKEAAMLPAPVQIDTLLKIGDLTFKDIGLKKSLETVAALLSKAKPEITKLKATKAE